jgi:PAS domain S-box-containing protein
MSALCVFTDWRGSEHMIVTEPVDLLLMLHALIESTDDHVYFKGLDSRFTLVNTALARSLGLKHPEEVVGRSDQEFFDAAQAKLYREAELLIMSTGQASPESTVKHIWLDGRETFSRHNARPLRNKHGEVIGVWGTNTDVTATMELERMVRDRTRELEAANSQLAQINRELAAETTRANAMTQRAVEERDTRTELLAVVSHDIRNPFQAIVGSTELLKDTPLQPLQRDYVDTIDEAARATLLLVDKLLDMSRLEADRLDLERVVFPLRETLENVARVVSVRAHAKQLEFSIDMDPEIPEYVQGDPTLLRQVLLNLAFNAVKFTERGEVVLEIRVVETFPENLTLRFEVRDTGIGISPDRLHALFQPYSQADASIARRFGGTGLGLFIVQRTVALMGGTSGVKSREGQGSTFWFTAPFLRAAHVDSRQPPTAPGMKGKVLVIDDTATQRAVLTRQLQRLGLDATSAGSAREALALLREAHAARRPFAVALVDHRMPECDGGELCNTINADQDLNVTRLVLLTSSQPLYEAFTSLGIAACLAKPVTERDLGDCLQVVLAGSVGDWHSHTSPVVTQNLLRARRGRASRHILVAEDTPASRMVACRTLERLGYRATGVADGRQAVTAWESGQFHLILMDWEMPEISGPEAARLIRSRERPGSRIPIVALTGRVVSGTELECQEAGMDAFLAKPVDREGLESCVARFLTETLDTTGVQPTLPVAPDKETPPIDLAGLREVAEGDGKWVVEVLREFTKQGASALVELEAAVASGDAMSIARVAHALKGTADGLKSHAVRRWAAELELAARQGRAEQYPRLVKELRHHVIHVTEYLCELLA